MKKLLGLLLVLALLLGCAGAEEAEAPALQKDLVILYTSDVHCGVDQNWGYASVLAAKEYYQNKDNYVLLVDDGDAIQGEPIGTMTTGEGIISIMNAAGYDIAIPGNHEFDYGMDTFLALTKEANFTYISCNFNKEGELVFPAYVIKEFDGVKIAFVGVTTPMTLRSSTPRYFMNDEGEFIYGFCQDDTGEKLYNAVQKAVDDARGEGANYVVLIAHLGNQAECSPYMYNEVIEHTSGIDVVLDGHSHDEVQATVKDKDGKAVPRSAVGTKLNNIGVLTIKKDGSLSTKVMTCHSDLSVPALTGIQNAAAKEVEVETTVLNRKLAEVVAKTSDDLITHDPETGERVVRRAETNLGDLCADAYRDQAGNADIAFVNGGGVRAPIAAGDITLNDILTVNPFGNALTVIEVTGQQVLDALEWGVHSTPGEFGGFLQVSGLTYEFDPTIESPCIQDENKMFGGIDDTKERRVRNVLVGGEPIDPAKTYTLASHDYMLLNSGDGYTMFKGAKVLQESVKLDNQVLIDYITQTLGGVVGEGYDKPYGEGRIVSVTAGE